MKKIFFCIPTLHGGGAERVFCLLINMLDRKRYKVELVLLRSNKHDRVILNKDVVIHDLKCSLPLAFIRLPNLIKREKPDIVLSTICYMNIVTGFCSWIFKSTQSVFIGRESGIPSVRMHYTKSIWNATVLYRLLYKHFDAVICQSKDMTEEVHELYHVPYELITTINNPIDLDYIRTRATTGTPLSYSNKDINLLAVGRLHPQKGYDLLIKALSKTKNKMIHLHILGSGEITDQLKALVCSLDLSSRVTFHGYVSNPYPFMLNADLFVISSIAEGFPNALLEALSLGCPSIAFDGLGGGKELIKHGINGSLVRLGDIETLAEEIDRCYLIKFDRNFIASNIASRYSITKILEQYENVFSNACNRKHNSQELRLLQ